MLHFRGICFSLQTVIVRAEDSAGRDLTMLSHASLLVRISRFSIPRTNDE